MTKYLGVILGARLTWREHVDTKVSKACNMLWACRRACGVRWGLRPTVVYWLYNSFFRLSVTFASLVWWPGCETTRAKQQLSIVQRLVCLGIRGAMCITPTSAVEALVGLPPLGLVVQGKARASAHCLWSLGSWSHLHPNRGHSSVMAGIGELTDKAKMATLASAIQSHRLEMDLDTLFHMHPTQRPYPQPIVWYVPMIISAGTVLYVTHFLFRLYIGRILKFCSLRNPRAASVNDAPAQIT
jgi:hypothetical protein